MQTKDVNFYVEASLIYGPGLTSTYEAVLKMFKCESFFINHFLRLDVIPDDFTLYEVDLEDYLIPQQMTSGIRIAGSVFDLTNKICSCIFSCQYLDSPIVKEDGVYKYFLIKTKNSDEAFPLSLYEEDYKTMIFEEIVKKTISKLKLERQIMAIAGKQFLSLGRFPAWYAVDSKLSLLKNKSTSEGEGEGLNNIDIDKKYIN